MKERNDNHPPTTRVVETGYGRFTSGVSLAAKRRAGQWYVVRDDGAPIAALRLLWHDEHV